MEINMFNSIIMKKSPKSIVEFLNLFIAKRYFWSIKDKEFNKEIHSSQSKSIKIDLSIINCVNIIIESRILAYDGKNRIFSAEFNTVTKELKSIEKDFKELKEIDGFDIEVNVKSQTIRDLINDYVKLIISVQGVWGDPYEKLENFGFRKIYIFSETYLSEILSYFTTNSNIEIISVSSEKKYYYPYRKRGFVSITYAEFLKIDDICSHCVIFADPICSHTDRLRDYVKKISRGATFFDLYSLFINEYETMTFLNPLIELKNKYKSTKFYISKFWRYIPSYNMSPHEKILKETGEQFFEKIYNEAILGNTLDEDPVYSKRGYDCQYIKEVLTRPDIKVSKYKHVPQKFFERKSKHVNYIDGFRVTTDIPQSFTEKTIYILGSSKIFGLGADDSHTIPSCLQKLLNNNGYSYRVVNASNYGGSNYRQQIVLLESLDLKPGDIVISTLHCEFSKFLDDSIYDYFPIIDVSHVFDRPHNYGEVFIDKCHVCSEGNKIVADTIFENLVEKGAFFETSLIKKEENSLRGFDANNIIKDPPLSNIEKLEFDSWINKISKLKKRIGCISMNCNPYTLGHKYLVEYASSNVDWLYIFVVEEDKSFFSFKDRFEMVKLGTQHLNNILIIPSGKFMCSARTFSAYSNKEKLQEKNLDPSMDIELFSQKTAPALNIEVRFAGEEPYDYVTRQHNDTMSRILPKYGIEFITIQRIKLRGKPISASKVRELLNKKKYQEIKELVPKTTFDYLRNLLQI